MSAAPDVKMRPHLEAEWGHLKSLLGIQGIPRLRNAKHTRFVRACSVVTGALCVAFMKRHSNDVRFVSPELGWRVRRGGKWVGGDPDSFVRELLREESSKAREIGYENVAEWLLTSATFHDVCSAVRSQVQS